MSAKSLPSIGEWITFRVLLPLSGELFNRPRGGWLAFELQMIGHGLIGNGWRRG